jgi:hypothetical protein
MAVPKWASRGAAAKKRMTAESEKQAKRSAQGEGGRAPSRFWMPKESQKDLIFLDDEPFVYDEHQWEEGGNWRNWCTCGGVIGLSCNGCDAGHKSYLAAAYTVVDCSKWTDKEGNEHRYTKRLYVAKTTTWEIIEREKALLMEDHSKSLTGAVQHLSVCGGHVQVSGTH